MRRLRKRLGRLWPLLILALLLFISIIMVVFIASATRSSQAAEFVRENYVIVSLFFGVATSMLVFGIEFLLAQRPDAASVVASADGNMSLSKTQTWWWTLTILGAYVAVFVAGYIQFASRGLTATPPALNTDLLLVLGLSAGNVIAARAIVVSQISNGHRLDKAVDVADQRDLAFSDLISNDNNSIDIYKLQLVAWTIIAIAIFGVQVVRGVNEMEYLVSEGARMRATGRIEERAAEGPTALAAAREKVNEGTDMLAAAVSLPSIGAELLLLMGISQATYLGGTLVTEAPKFMVLISHAEWPTAGTNPTQMSDIIIVNGNSPNEPDRGVQVISGWKLALLPGGDPRAVPKAVFPLRAPPDAEVFSLRGGEELVIKWTTDILPTSERNIWQVSANPPEPGDTLVLRDVTNVVVNQFVLIPPPEPTLYG